MVLNVMDELRLSYLRAAQASQKEDEDKIIVYRDFFEGTQGIVLSTRQGEYLTKSPKSFGNICKRTVNIPKDKLQITEAGIAPQGDDGGDYADQVTQWWTSNHLNARQKELYEAALRDGCGALIVGWDETKQIPTFTQNLVYDGQSGQIRFHYDGDGNLLFASKRWTVWNPLITGATGKRRLTIYRPDMIQRYEASSGWPDGWRPLEPFEINGLPNPQPWVDSNGGPLGIPVIPFDNPGGSELADVVNIQELLNHGLATFDIATDYHGWPILWLALNGNIQLPTEDGYQKLPNFGPKTSFNVGEGGQAGRIEPADLEKMFRSGVLSWVQILAAIKGWPYFMFDKTDTPPSGVSLRIQEGPLVSQIEDKQMVFGEAWRQAFDMGRKLHRLKTGGDLPGEIAITWKDPRTPDKTADAEAMQKRFDALQLPIVTRWKEAGYSQDDIEEMMRLKDLEGSGMLSGDLVTGVEQ